MIVSSSETRANATFGFWSAVGTGIATLVTFSIAILTPPRSGALCTGDCHRYPYLDIAARFPRDYYWMYAAIAATLLYVAFALAVATRASPTRRLVAQLGVLFSVMAALTVVMDYYLQLTVVQPSLLAGESDGVSLLTQFNEHGVFIALEELGYLLMSASLACLASAVPGTTRLERAVRWLFAGGFAVTCAALVYFLVRYGHGRGYLFEIAVITVTWLTLIPGTFMMAAVFRRDASAP
jgi:hypothetical protein